MSKRISMLPSKPKAPVFHEPVERAAHPLNPRLNRSTDALSLSTITMHASRSQTNLATPNKRRNFLGKLAGAFRSRADLKETTRIDKAPVVGGSASVKGAPSIRARTPAYDRPVIPNEGDTESPCLYNVTTVQFDRASVRSARPQQPQVISV
jgi:hypothetical protein